MLLLSSLFMGMGVGVAVADPTDRTQGTVLDQSTLSHTVTSVVAEASRDTTRQSLGTVVADGEYALDDSSTGTVDSGKVARLAASNEQVAILMTTRDAGQLPAGFNADHPTNDNGGTYAFSQCTWWVYQRRHQLGLPVGSHYGNGHQWADSARALGYWVDSTPRQGDIMVFARGQDGSSLLYGHVAVVERVNDDGSIDTSECGASYNGKPFTRHFTAEQAAQHQFIHY